MSNEDIIRAWKDEGYRNSLSITDLAQIPDNPAGLIELTDAEMILVGGGYDVEGPTVTQDNTPTCQPKDTTDYICRTTKGGSECKPKEDDSFV